MQLQQALLIVDVQVDFCEGGALAIPQADILIPILNKYIKLFSKGGLPVFASRDWHPSKTGHFNQFGGQWPSHCVEQTPGAQFHPHLKLPEEAIILSKGTAPDDESYSAFQAADSQDRPFNTLLKRFGITRLFIGGLATDYCVKWSVLDALKFGYKVLLLKDAIKGVNLNPKDSDEAVQEMQRLGAETITLEKATRLFSSPKHT